MLCCSYIVCLKCILYNTVILQPASDSIEVCIGSTVEVNCTTFTADLAWETDDCFIGSYVRSANTDIVQEGCDFVVKLVSSNPWLVSTATLNNVQPIHNATVLTCLNTILPSVTEEQMASITIIVAGNTVMLEAWTYHVQQLK